MLQHVYRKFVCMMIDHYGAGIIIVDNMIVTTATVKTLKTIYYYTCRAVLTRE